MDREWGNKEKIRKCGEWSLSISSSFSYSLSIFLQPGCDKMEKKWGNEEEMERDSLSTFPQFLFLIYFLYQKLSHFVAKCWKRHFNRECHKKLIYALWENNSGSTSLRESSASCKGLTNSRSIISSTHTISSTNNKSPLSTTHCQQHQ